MKHIIKKKKETWQCAYNLIVTCVRATISAVQKQYILHIMSVALFIQYEMHMSRTVICDLPGSKILFHVVS